MSQRQECLKNVKSVAPMELYSKLSKFGNKRLGHIWDFTPSDILKVMECIICYTVEEGEEPKEKELRDILLRKLEWNQADGAVRIQTWSI